MIDITIPSFDMVVKRSELKSIPNHKNGVYLLHNNEEGLIYVGQTQDIKSRLYAHFSGCTNTSMYSKYFDYCELFYENDLIKREIYEYYLINTRNPILNAAKKRNQMPSNETIRARSETMKCNGTTKEGKKCNKYAQTNGYCNVHGGNGISFSSVREEAIARFLEEEKQKEQPTAK